MMDLGDKLVALAAIGFINAMFALVLPWMAMFSAIASLPLAAAIVFR
ncbi:hypothetical protein [Haloarchaeobius amylolyticus]|nr:hypothetical protein [Haloarchaeobius amylolyticus]